jgi:hypothetical protein
VGDGSSPAPRRRGLRVSVDVDIIPRLAKIARKGGKKKRATRKLGKARQKKSERDALTTKKAKIKNFY